MFGFSLVLMTEKRVLSVTSLSPFMSCYMVYLIAAEHVNSFETLFSVWNRNIVASDLVPGGTSRQALGLALLGQSQWVETRGDTAPV